MSSIGPSADDHALPDGGGEVAALMRKRDWSACVLGSPETWPQSLRLVVDLMVSSKFPMFVAWGPDLGFLYNDAYAEILGEKHPSALGARFHDIWAEIWDDIAPLIEAAMAGEATFRQDLPLIIHRKGFDEQTWFTFSYSPVRDESGAVAGMFCACTETTGRVLAERAVRESETRFRNMADHAPVMMWVTDPSGYCTYLNRVWYEFTGQSARQAEGYGWLDAIHPDDKLEAERVFLEANAAQASFRFEYRLRRADGTYRWALDAAAPRFDADGAYLGYVGSVIDIDARRETENALRASEAQFRLMADAVPQIVWITDAQGRIQFFNRQWFDYTGARSLEVSAGEVADNHVHPDDAAATMTAFEQALRDGKTYVIEHRIRSAAGEYRWFLVRGEPYRDPETGAIARWFGASVDIHDRKLAEDALRALNADLELEVVNRSRERGLIWQLSLDLLSVVDLETGRFDAVNPAWETALGWSVGDVPGRVYADLVHPDDLPASDAAFAQVRRGEPVLQFENRYRSKDGSWRWLSWVAVPDEGKLYSVTRDITAEKERQAELEAAQEALRQSQKMEAMGQLTGGVAHDFNNLLTPIVGSLDMLQRKGLGGEREQRLISGAMQSAERARTLVQRLLAFARRQPLQPVPVNIAELVCGMGDLVSSTTGPQIKVVVDAAPGMPPANVDPNQLEMAILNLAVNARDAMPDGGTLRITAIAETIGRNHPTKLRKGSYIRLCVADTGVGMDEATLARAVEPFFSTKGIGKGTGLGLSMVHGLASQLGGALAMDSRPGEGTSVDLWLPQSAAAPDLAEPHTQGGLPPLSRGTALLVEDEELVRISTADMLTDLGYAIVEADSGEEALRLVEAGQAFDVLITDHLMPGMSGTDLARAVRRLRPGTPVLLVSGYAEQDGVAADLPRMTKPFRKDELERHLARLQAG